MRTDILRFSVIYKTMEEKKKRWRPSLTAYRELQRQVDEALVSLSKARKDVLSCKTELDALRRSNSLMEKELSLQQQMNDDLNKQNWKLRDELFDLKNRGFWARVFNREV